VKVSIKAEDGMTYDVVWRSIQQLSLAGVQKDGLTVGDHVTAKGSKQAEDAAHVSLLLTEIHKSGGVQWSQPPQGC
jgi:hypothetical protein